MTIDTRVFSLARAAVATALLAPYALAGAQVLTFSDLLKGQSLPMTMKPADLPAGFVALKTTQPGVGDVLGMSNSILPFMLIGSMGGSGTDSEQFKLVKALGVSWSDGSTVQVSGQTYLVTYKLDVDLADLAGMRSAAVSADAPPMAGAMGPSPSIGNAVLKLTLLKTDSIQSITPDPGYTKEQFVAALGGQRGGSSASAQVQALSNGKQIGLGLMLYAQDFDDQLPAVQSTKSLQELVGPYIKHNNLWNDPNPNGARFLFNMNLAGVVQTAIGEPANTPMIFEDKPWPDGRRVVVYADGHAKLVDGDGWPAVAKALTQKFKRTGRPLPMNYGGSVH